MNLLDAVEQQRRDRLAEDSCATIQRGHRIDSVPKQPPGSAPILDNFALQAELMS
jgi:hypothetical protein